MKIFFDTEFIEDGRTIDLLSIGAVREDGKTYYAEVTDGGGPGCTPRMRASMWVREKVFPHLTMGPTETQTTGSIAMEFLAFVGPNPEFWAYYADYDWVALCQLYGRMIDLPDNWPMYCRDLKQLADEVGLPRSEYPQQPKDAHNALNDAKWNQCLWTTIASWRHRQL